MSRQISVGPEWLYGLHQGRCSSRWMKEGPVLPALLATQGAFPAASPRRSLLLDLSAPEECPHLEATGLGLTCRPDHLQARSPAGLLFNPAVHVGHPEGAQAWIMVTLNLFSAVPGGSGEGGGVGGRAVSRSQRSPTGHFSGPSRSSHVCFLQEEHQSPT